MNDPVGRIGRYAAVYELGRGVESFLPQAAANPRSGEAGNRTSVPSIAFKTYVKGSGSALDEFVKKSG